MVSWLSNVKSLQRENEDICEKKNVKWKCWWVTANVSKRLALNVTKGKYIDKDKLGLSAETSVHADTHLACRWRRESGGGDSGWPRLIHRSSAGGRRSEPYPPPRLLHSLLALPDNGLRDRKRDVNIVIQRLDNPEERRGKEKKTDWGNRELLNSLEVESFKI